MKFFTKKQPTFLEKIYPDTSRKMAIGILTLGAASALVVGLIKLQPIRRLRSKMNERALQRSLKRLDEQGVSITGIDIVEQASEESFPASDSPGYMRGH